MSHNSDPLESSPSARRRRNHLETFERTPTRTASDTPRSTAHTPDGAGCRDDDPAWRGL